MNIAAAQAQTSTHMVGIGPTKLLDTYLTPEKFSGTGFTYLYIKDYAPADSLRRWTTTIEHELKAPTIYIGGDITTCAPSRICACSWALPQMPTWDLCTT